MIARQVVILPTSTGVTRGSQGEIIKSYIQEEHANIINDISVQGTVFSEYVLFLLLLMILSSSSIFSLQINADQDNCRFMQRDETKPPSKSHTWPNCRAAVRDGERGKVS